MVEIVFRTEKMKTLIGFFIGLLCLLSHAEKSEPEWRWFYTGISPFGSDVFVRSGTAKVIIKKSEISWNFVEPAIPESNANFRGKITTSGQIRGSLNEFFMHGPDLGIGTYRKQAGAQKEKCKHHEIILKGSGGSPDGAIFLLFRTEGLC